jgi:hypothetical protein
VFDAHDTFLLGGRCDTTGGIITRIEAARLAMKNEDGLRQGGKLEASVSPVHQGEKVIALEAACDTAKTKEDRKMTGNNQAPEQHIVGYRSFCEPVAKEKSRPS